MSAPASRSSATSPGLRRVGWVHLVVPLSPWPRLVAEPIASGMAVEAERVLGGVGEDQHASWRLRRALADRPTRPSIMSEGDITSQPAAALRQRPADHDRDRLVVVDVACRGARRRGRAVSGRCPLRTSRRASGTACLTRAPLGTPFLGVVCLLASGLLSAARSRKGWRLPCIPSSPPCARPRLSMSSVEPRHARSCDRSSRAFASRTNRPDQSAPSDDPGGEGARPRPAPVAGMRVRGKSTQRRSNRARGRGTSADSNPIATTRRVGRRAMGARRTRRASPARRSAKVAACRPRALAQKTFVAVPRPLQPSRFWAKLALPKRSPMAGTASATSTRLPLDPVPETELGRLFRLLARPARGLRRACPLAPYPPGVCFCFILGRVNLVDVRDGSQFRYRLVGTKIATVGGGDMQGQLVPRSSRRSFARPRREPLRMALRSRRRICTRCSWRAQLCAPLLSGSSAYAPEPGSGCIVAMMPHLVQRDNRPRSSSTPYFVGMVGLAAADRGDPRHPALRPSHHPPLRRARGRRLLPSTASVRDHRRRRELEQ